MSFILKSWHPKKKNCHLEFPSPAACLDSSSCLWSNGSLVWCVFGMECVCVCVWSYWEPDGRHGAPVAPQKGSPY